MFDGIVDLVGPELVRDDALLYSCLRRAFDRGEEPTVVLARTVRSLAVGIRDLTGRALDAARRAAPGDVHPNVRPCPECRVGRGERCLPTCSFFA